jgi:plastocyanin
MTSMQRRILTFLAVAALAVGLAACGSSSKSSSSGGGSGSGSGSGTITIDSSFNFSQASVPAGATVTVKNDSSTQHTVTQDGGGFDVTIDGGKTATFTAPSKPGTYKFHCKIHSFMHGTLTVT